MSTNKEVEESTTDCLQASLTSHDVRCRSQVRHRLCCHPQRCMLYHSLLSSFHVRVTRSRTSVRYSELHSPYFHCEVAFRPVAAFYEMLLGLVVVRMQLSCK